MSTVQQFFNSLRVKAIQVELVELKKPHSGGFFVLGNVFGINITALATGLGIGGIAKSVFGIPNTGFGHLKLLHTGRKRVGVTSSSNIGDVHELGIGGTLRGDRP